MRLHDPKITVKNADVLDYPCNVLVLKYAQWWHGADLAVGRELGLGKGWDSGGEFLAPGEFRLLPGDKKIGADQVLFVGLAPLKKLTYSLLREFGKSAILHLNKVAPQSRHLAMTIHGVNIGMDEREVFLAQLAGILDVLSDPQIMTGLEEISFVEKNAARAKRLAEILAENYKPRISPQLNELSRPISDAGCSQEKPHIFVAMPFLEEMEDTFIFGIHGPVQEAGFLCERVDIAVFTGDIVERIKSRIETAQLVIADLTGANANVYLEVGYAWGCKVNTLLICKNVDELKFDVKGQRCLIYSSINDLKKKLSSELKFHARTR
ncbi:MAG: hypothetical protein K2X27_24210 [Candidatus Obscuribacterales bacterium]|nr:hypothetical protein [Candidatus Obscuribacterales bacterium]